MTFEHLQEQWKRQEARFDTIIHFNVAQARISHLDSMTTAVDRVRRTIWIELLFDAFLLIVLGSFMGTHIRDVRYMVPVGILHICVIVAVMACVRQLLVARRVDYTMPIIETQRTLTLLKMSRIQSSKWTLLVAPALWTPLLIVTVKGVFQIDFYSSFDSRWIAANILWSVALIPLMLWVARRYGEQLSSSPLLQRLANDLAGRSLNDATAFAQRLVEFERQYDDIRAAG